MRDPKRVMASTTLVMEALAVFFAALAAAQLTDLGQGRALALGGGLSLVLLLTAGLLRRRGGYALGSVLQAVVVGGGVLYLPLAFVGVVFAGLWLVSLAQGDRIARERAVVERGLIERRGADDG